MSHVKLDMAEHEFVERDVECVGNKVARFLGYDCLKPEQRLVLKEILKSRDVFAVLPTGYGKSLCYACLPLMYDELFKEEPSIVIVLTPLIAIMKDQVFNFSY